MKNNTSKIMLILNISIFVLLLTIIFLQTAKINALTERLEAITIFDWIEGTISLKNALNHSTPLTAVTPEFIDHSFLHHSPFLDGYDLKELKEKYLKYRNTDLYGSGRRTGNFRRIHEGIDLYVPEDTPVYPLFPIGLVTAVSHDPDHVIYTTGLVGNTRVDSVAVEYGKIVRILYPEGIESLYAHLNEVYVEIGELVTGDTVVGLTGYTGNIRNSGKPSHLHLELHDCSSESFDPETRMHYQFASLRHFIDNYLDNYETSSE
jgi:hypothetical protein